VKKKLPLGPRVVIDNVSLQSGGLHPSQGQSCKVPLIREDTALSRVQSLKKPKGPQTWRVGLWTQGAVVSRALKVISNSHPAPQAPDNHQQKVDPEGIIPEFSEPTRMFDSF